MLKEERFNFGLEIKAPPHFFCFLGLHPLHMEVPRSGVESELQLPASTTATATPDPSHVCDLHHSSRQRQILNPRGQGSNPQPTTSWFLVRFCFCCAMMGTLEIKLFFFFFFFFFPFTYRWVLDSDDWSKTDIWILLLTVRINDKVKVSFFLKLKERR